MASAGEAIRGAIPQPQLDQSVIIFGALALAFFIYLTVTPYQGTIPGARTHLQAWLAIFGV